MILKPVYGGLLSGKEGDVLCPGCHSDTDFFNSWYQSSITLTVVQGSKT